MVDVSVNLFNTLPTNVRTASRIPSGVSLEKSDANRTGVNSVKNILPKTDAVGPKAINQVGFSSLTPVLQALRPPPVDLSQPTKKEMDEKTPFYQELLDQQDSIVEARKKSQANAEEIIRQRRRSAAELAAIEERARQIRETILLSSKPRQSNETAIEDQLTTLNIRSGDEIFQSRQPQFKVFGETNEASKKPEPAPLIGQGKTKEVQNSLENTKTPPEPFKIFPQPKEKNFSIHSLKIDQQEFKDLYSTPRQSPSTGTTINTFV